MKTYFKPIGLTINIFFALEVVKQYVSGGIQTFFNIKFNIKFINIRIQFVISLIENKTNQNNMFFHDQN